MDREFLEDLASTAPTPGGGGASAYCGALAAALASMVGNLTVGKARYADIEEAVCGSLDRLGRLRDRLLSLVDEDAAGFAPLAASFRMPSDTTEQAQEKRDAQQRALAGACEPPMKIMRCCAEVIEQCDFLARNGSRMVLSDAGVAVLFAKAALQGASLNVLINAKSMDDVAQASRYRCGTSELIEVYGARADEIYEYVCKEIA